MNRSDPFLESLVVIIERHLGAAIQFISLFGSRARQENHSNSDADIFVVTTSPVHPDLVKKLIEDLRLIYLEYGCLFDETFPIEVINTFELKLALDGYGYVHENGLIVTDTIGPSDWSQFNSYRQWLAALATPSDFLAGDKDVYRAAVEKAKYTMLRLLLLSSRGNSVKADDLFAYAVSWGKEGYGFIDSTYTRSYINDNYYSVLGALSEEGVSVINGMVTILNRSSLIPRGVKDISRYIAEKEYLGVHDTSSTINDYYQAIQELTRKFIDQPVLNYMNAPDLALLSKRISLEKDIESSIKSLEVLLRYSIRQNHPRYVAFPDAGNSKSALLAAALEPILNQNMIAVDKSAPIGTFIEIDLIRTLRKLIGYNSVPEQSALDLGGVSTAGGIAANATALLVARTKAFPSARASGLHTQSSKGYLLVSAETLEHYSHKASFWWLGLGEENVIAVASNNYDFDLVDLEEKLKKYNTNGNKVVAVIALAGDSRTTHIQNIRQIHDLTNKYETWLHLDACHGGIGLFSSQRDTLCADYKLVDSISIDPHKGLAIPYASSYCLFKKPDDLAKIAKSTDITIARGSFDLGQITPFAGSRPFDSLKLWYTLKERGLSKLAEDIDYRIGLAKIWYRLILKSKYFIPLHEPVLTALSFTVDPKKLGISFDQVSKLNKIIHDRAYREGWFIIHCFELVDYGEVLEPGNKLRLMSLGVNFGNIQLDASTLEVGLEYLETLIEDALSVSSDIEQRKDAVVPETM